jgi:hypothetical protein
MRALITGVLGELRCRVLCVLHHPRPTLPCTAPTRHGRAVVEVALPAVCRLRAIKRLKLSSQSSFGQAVGAGRRWSYSARAE